MVIRGHGRVDHGPWLGDCVGVMDEALVGRGHEMGIG